MNCSNIKHGILAVGVYKNVTAKINGGLIVIGLCKACYNTYCNNQANPDVPTLFENKGD